MQLKMNFNDGMVFTQDFDEFEKQQLISQKEGTNILGYFITGKQNNASIAMNIPYGQCVERKYRDLYSVEVIF